MIPTPTSLFLTWSIIGTLAGVFAYLIQTKQSSGVPANIVDGILGACVGGLILRRLGISSSGALAELLAATTGAFAFLFLIGHFRRA